MAIGAFLLSLVTVSFDQRSTSAALAESLGFVWSGGAEGARSLLSTIAGSMITVAGVVFSITIVALTLASSQFGPRLLRNFVRDTGNQITLGTFISTFLYCILVLRTVRGQNEGSFIPFISITCGVALGIASLGVLIFFIHHVSISIQAENLVAKVGRELCRAVDEHFPENQVNTSHGESQELFDQSLRSLIPVPFLSTGSGYLQRIDRDKLISHAQKTDSRIVLKKSPGDFVLSGDVLAEIWGGCAEKPPDEKLEDLTELFGLGGQRTASQDVRYGARQLAEIAARALSPGINDPYTAMGCIDWMVDALSRVLRRAPARELLADDRGTARLKEAPPTFSSMCVATLEPIIAYGLDSAIVARYITGAISRLAGFAVHPEDVASLQSFSTRIVSQARVLLKDEEALEEIVESANSLRQQLAQKFPLVPH